MAGRTKLHLWELPALERTELAEWLQTVDDLLRVVAVSGLVYGSHVWQRCFPFLAVLPAYLGLVVGGQQSP